MYSSRWSAPYAGLVALILGGALFVVGWWLLLDTWGLGTRFKEFLKRTRKPGYRNPFVWAPPNERGVRRVGIVCVVTGVALLVASFELTPTTGCGQCKGSAPTPSATYAQHRSDHSPRAKSL
jgi:hypothetical protein